ncbi:MAG TPA: sigma-70 family RNA polymerase sigma factor [Chloroflexaceae bacterium]|nr:sigma-70 family RNA polymerase sigma factor [Chloroflexaceae bacterium]
MSDAELVARLKDRDEDAYREVLARYSDPLYRYLYGITGEAQLSQDLLGETFLRVVEQIDRYTYRGAPFKSWLYRIAHNLAISAVTRERRMVAVPDLEQVARPITDPAIRVADQLEQAALRSALRTSLPELTEEQQQVIVLRFLSGLSLAETAEAMGKNENAIKQLQFRALRALERQIERRTSHG